MNQLLTNEEVYAEFMRIAKDHGLPPDIAHQASVALLGGDVVRMPTLKPSSEAERIYDRRLHARLWEYRNAQAAARFRKAVGKRKWNLS